MSAPGNRVRDVVIVGGDATGWLCAASLVRALKQKGGRVRVVEAPGAVLDFGALGGGAAALPSLRALHAILGIDERAFMRSAGATFKLGTEFRDWGRLGDSYFHPHGELGAGMEAIGFHHFWLKLQGEGAAEDLGAYSLAIEAARRGKFAMPVDDPASALSTLSYSYHFDAEAYARLLRAYAEERGAVRTEGELVDVILRGTDGSIEAVTLVGGERVEGDFFIDCTGPRALLIEGALKAGFEDWRRWMACDRAIAVSHARAGPPVPYARAQAIAAGWRWTIPLQRADGKGLVYASEHMSEEAVSAALFDGLDGDLLAPPRRLSFVSGRRRSLWVKNCVAVGAAGACLEPLEGAELHLAQSGVTRLIGLFPDRSFAAAERDEYNRVMTNEIERLRDFLILHYKATERTDTPFWRARREMSLPEELDYKLKVFKSRGRVVLLDEEAFAEPSWISVLIGQRVRPRRHDPMADMVDVETVRGAMSRMRRTIEQTAQAMPTHGAFLERYCGEDTMAGGPR